jgi:hypothetical protein
MALLSLKSAWSVSKNTAVVPHSPTTARNRYIRILETSTSAGQGGDYIRAGLLPGLPPDHLALARHDSGTNLFLRFSDGQTAIVDFAKLGIDTSRLRMDTASASAEGSAVEIKDRRGKMVHIDSAVLRAHCDPKYAAELRQAIAEVIAR